MKKIILFFLLLFTLLQANAQKIGPEYLPPRTKEMPKWFTIFYDEVKLKKANVFSLDEQAQQYELELRKNNDDGENPYLVYYKRWRRAVTQSVNENGKVEYTKDEDVIPQLKASIDLQNKAIAERKQDFGAASPWTLIGPKQTTYNANENGTQPPFAAQVNVYRGAVAKSNTNVLYVAPETGGIFKTIDKGLNWTLVYDKPAVNAASTYAHANGYAYTSIAIDDLDENLVYIGRNNLIEKSVDGGVTWTQRVLASGGVREILINPLKTSTLYIGAGDGIWRSYDSGENWQQVAGTDNFDIRDLDYKPGDTMILIAARTTPGAPITSQIFKSIDGGDSFTLSNSGFPTTASGATRIAFAQINSNIIYALHVGATVPSIVKSTDAGDTWTVMCTGTTGLLGDLSMPLGMSNGQGYYDMAIYVNPMNDNEVLAGTTTMYKSTNGGTSFSAVGGYVGSFPTHPDFQSIFGIGNDTWVTTDGGVNYSSDFFSSLANHSVRSKGIFGTDYWGFTQGWNEDVQAGGKFHNANGVLSETYGDGVELRFNGAEAGTGHYIAGRPYHIAFSDLNNWPGGGLLIAPSTFNGSNKGIRFNKFPGGQDNGYAPSEVEQSPIWTDHLYLGNGNDFFKSTDYGNTWSVQSTLPANVRRFEISRSNPNVIYLATSAALYKSINEGVSFTQLTLPAAITSAHFYNFHVQIDPRNENNIWISGLNFPAGNRVFKSTNGGASWTNLTTATIDTRKYRTMVHIGGTDGGVYLFAEGGYVYYRNNAMPDWVAQNTNLPLGTYPLHAIPFYRDSKIRMSGNRGIWSSSFFEPAAPVAQPSVRRNVLICSRDTVQFEDFSMLDHAGATWTWSFPGASYVSSATVRNPKVLYSTPGSYDVSLTVTNANGTSSKTIPNMVTLSPTSICNVDTIPGKSFYTKTTSIYDYGRGVAELKIPSNSNFTIMGWFKPDLIQNTTDIAGWFTVSGKKADGTDVDYVIGSSTAPSVVDSTMSMRGYGATGVLNGTKTKAGQWNHVAVTYTYVSAASGGRVDLYINGILGTSTNVSHVQIASEPKLTLGTFATANWDAYRYYSGEVDELAVFKRTLTRTEIRTVMHLSQANPSYSVATDADLIHYYQFNEPTQEFITTDRKGNSHMERIGGNTSIGTTSTAPVGGGVSQLITVNNDFLKDYTVPGVKLDFKTGTYPNGEVYVSRINVPADELPGSKILPHAPTSYYVIRSFGNQNFTGLDSIVFYNVGGITSNMIGDPSQINLFKRASNTWGTTWGSSVGSASEVRLENGSTYIGAIKFSTGLNVTNFSQFSMTSNFAILPIVLVDFKAQLDGNVVQLQWSTSSETSNGRFEIERSSNGLSWDKVLSTPSSGLSNQLSKYNKTDFFPLKGISFYRLKLLDANGKITYSKVEMVNRNGKQSLVVLPNPAHDIVTLTGAEGLHPNQIRIFDVQGREVTSNVQRKLIGSGFGLQLDVQQLPTGIYTISFNGQSTKLLKQ